MRFSPDQCAINKDDGIALRLVRFVVPIQPIAATHSSNFSAGE
jgi:hypothetical protein